MPRTYKYTRTNSRKNSSSAGNTQSKKKSPPASTPLLAFRDLPPDPDKTLLGRRFLCVEGAMLLIGPSGVGKSSLTAQATIQWSIGQTAFDINPSRPLKITIIQAEDDKGDIYEMVAGAVVHLKLTPEEIALSEKNCQICFHKALTGDEFLEDVIGPVLERDRPDIIVINPLQAYLGADVKETDKVSKFLRNGLNPLLEQYQCAAIVVHHTPKTNFRNTEKWRASDWMYGGAGAADITNWARAVIIIEPTNVDKVFKFIAAKRGIRLEWKKDEQGYNRHFAWAEGSIFWRDATTDEIKKTKEKKATKGTDEVLSMIPETGVIAKKELIERVNLDLEMGEKKIHSCINSLIREGRIFKHEKPRPGVKAEIFLSRFPAAAGSESSEP